MMRFNDISDGDVSSLIRRINCKRTNTEIDIYKYTYTVTQTYTHTVTVTRTERERERERECYINVKGDSADEGKESVHQDVVLWSRVPWTISNII